MLEKLTLKHISSIGPLRQFPPPLVTSDPSVRRSSILCIVYSSHFTAFSIECGIALLIMDIIRSEGTNWMHYCPKQPVAWIG